METVTLLIPTQVGTDSSGEPIPGYDDELPIDGCIVWPSSSREDLEVGVMRTVDEWTVAFPPGTVITADARAMIRGRVFHAMADGFAWASPFTGWAPGVVASFKKVAPNG